LPFDSLPALRKVLHTAHPHLAAIGDITPSDTMAAVSALAAIGGATGRDAFVGPIGDFYLTNPIARASGIMAECSALARGAKLEAAE
jgi:NADH-quinone oxidoreductase subunit G